MSAMAQARGDGIGQARPVPARFRWLKWIGVAVAIVIVALVGLRWWWGVVAAERLQAAIDELKAAGYPTTMADLQPPPVPDEDNAAYFFTQAFAVWQTDRKDAADDATFLQDNAEALALVERARSCSGCNWGVQYTSPGIAVPLPHLRLAGRLALRLSEVAKSRHQLGDDAGAIEAINDILHIAERLDQHGATLIEHLVANAIDGIAADTVKTIAPQLRNSDAAAGSEAAVEPANREQVDNLIARLLNETWARQGHVNSWRGEMVLQLDMGRLVADGKLTLPNLSPASPFHRGVSFVIIPLYELDMVFMSQYYRAVADAAGTDSRAQANALLPPPPAFQSWRAYTTRPLSRTFLTKVNAAVDSRYRRVTATRTAAVQLARRRYEVDHGQPPADLKALVPDYLEAIPQDPSGIETMEQMLGDSADDESSGEAEENNDDAEDRAGDGDENQDAQ